MKERLSKRVSKLVFGCFPFGFEGRIWDLIVSVPDHCLSFYFASTLYFDVRCNSYAITINVYSAS